MIKSLIEKLSKKPVYILIFVCLTLFFYKLGSYKLIDVDEPRYAEAAREMLLSHNWITPYFNYVIRLDKPIFFYWLIAIFYKIFGINEFAARFPSALLASSSVMFLYYFVKQTISKNVAFITAFVLATSIEFIVLARTSITDMTLSFFIIGTIMSGYLGSTAQENHKKYWWWLAYFLSGIAVLTKGPVGFVLPAAVFGIYFLLTGQLKENLKLKYTIPGILIFFATTLPWYYLMIKTHGKYFIDYFILKNNFQRFAGVNFSEHSGPFYYYLPVILVGFIPWILSFIPALVKYLRELIIGYKPSFKGEESVETCCFKSKYCICQKLALFKNADNRTKILLFSNIWFFVVLIFFSISSAKLVTYVLPLFPAMAILTGLFWHEYIFEEKNKLSINIPTAVFSSLLILAGFIFIFALRIIYPRIDTIISPDNIYICNINVLVTFIFIPIISLFCIKKDYKSLLFASLVVFMVNFTFTAVKIAMPIVYSQGQSDLVSYIKYAERLKVPAKNLIVFGMEKPSIVFYSGKKITFTDENYDLLNSYIKKKEIYLIIMKNRNVDKINGKLKFYLINGGVRYSLVINKQKDKKTKKWS